VDRAARGVLDREGYGAHFIHRTGHSIGTEVHGFGANIDDYETQERRHLLPGTLFSVEPGVYTHLFGVRSEIDVYFGEGEAYVTTAPAQTAIVPILKEGALHA
jgi:Xaa-Pro aminopeptidase